MFTTDQKKIIALSSLGGALEFYDFIVFIFMAKILSTLFFPAVNHIAALMGVFAIFAIGYLARPLGGFIFGHFGDKYGRKKTFLCSVLLMAIPIFLMGLLPIYQTIGIWAPCLLVILRLLQGMSVGGEVPGAIVFITETIMSGRRGLAAGLILFGINMGMVMGSLLSALLVHLLNTQQLMSWGWRIPFLLGGMLGVVSYYLRKRMQETPIFQSWAKRQEHIFLPIKEVVVCYPGRVLQGITLTALEAVMVSIFYLYLPTYLTSYFHFSLANSLWINTLNIFVFSIPVLFMSYLSDQIGRKKVMRIGIVFMCVFPWLLFELFKLHNFGIVFLVTSLCGLFASFVTGVFPCVMAELFPTRVRYSGAAICYNLGFGIIGGLTPLIATGLIHWTGNVLAPSWLIMIVAILALIAFLFMRETYREPLS